MTINGNGFQPDYVPDPPSIAHRPQRPPRASQSFVNDPAARSEIVRHAQRAGDNSGTLQWLHDHPSGRACNDGCGPLE